MNQHNSKKKLAPTKALDESFDPPRHLDDVFVNKKLWYEFNQMLTKTNIHSRTSC